MFSREFWYAAIKDFIWARSSELSLSQQNIKGDLAKNKLDILIYFSGLDNDVGAPVAVPPPKEGKQKNASKKEVGNIETMPSLNSNASRSSHEDSKSLPVIWRRQFTTA